MDLMSCLLMVSGAIEMLCRVSGAKLGSREWVQRQSYDTGYRNVNWLEAPVGPTNVMEGMSGPVCEVTASDLSLPGFQEGKKIVCIRVPSLHP